MPSSLGALKISSILGMTAAVLALDWFYLTYLLAHGFELQTQEAMVGAVKLSIPLQWLPIFGVVLVSLITWYEAYFRLLPRRGGLELDPLARLRLIRAIAFSLVLFVIFLYIPTLISSDWFWGRLSEAGRSITQARDFGLWLLGTVQSSLTADLLWQYSLGQTIAPAVMVLAAWVFARTTRRPKKQR